MKRIDLIKEQHEVKIGDVCGTIEPNITEDSLFYDNGEVIGFYIKDMNKYSERLTKLSDVANKEFRSKNVPKSVMTRSSIMKGYAEGGTYSKENIVQQILNIKIQNDNEFERFTCFKYYQMKCAQYKKELCSV